jgi:hypothetical protein
MTLSPLAEGNQYSVYQVLIGRTWYTIEPGMPLLWQTKGMRGYRMFDGYGHLVKVSTIK